MTRAIAAERIAQLEDRLAKVEEIQEALIVAIWPAAAESARGEGFTAALFEHLLSLPEEDGAMTHAQLERARDLYGLRMGFIAADDGGPGRREVGWQVVLASALGEAVSGGSRMKKEGVDHE